MGKYGLKSGYGYFQNIQAGTVDISTNASGDGSADVTFERPMKGTPVVVATLQETDTTGTLYVTSRSATGFTIKVDGSSVTEGTLTVAWIAMHDTKPSKL